MHFFLLISWPFTSRPPIQAQLGNFKLNAVFFGLFARSLMVTVCLTNVTALILNVMTSQELLSGEQELCCPFLPLPALCSSSEASQTPVLPSTRSNQQIHQEKRPFAPSTQWEAQFPQPMSTDFFLIYFIFFTLLSDRLGSFPSNTVAW